MRRWSWASATAAPTEGWGGRLTAWVWRGESTLGGVACGTLGAMSCARVRGAKTTCPIDVRRRGSGGGHLLVALATVLCAWGCTKTETTATDGDGAGTASGSVSEQGAKEPGLSPDTSAALAVALKPPDFATFDDDALAALYREVTESLDVGALTPAQRVQLSAVGDHADDPHLRANAWLALGSLAHDEGRLDEGIKHFQDVVALLPGEPAGHAVLAMALAARERYDEAITAQEKLVELDPDDLQAWLIWGELEVKAGHSEKASRVYAGYEMRRKGLLDGLTLQTDGVYRLRAEDRANCATALAAAPDNGTAMGLLYALSSDPDPSVRESIVGAMGTQRFVGYLKPLEHHLTVETTTAMKVATLAAIGEIRADPVETRPGVAPVGSETVPLNAGDVTTAARKGAPVAE